MYLLCNCSGPDSGNMFVLCSWHMRVSCKSSSQVTNTSVMSRTGKAGSQHKTAGGQSRSACAVVVCCPPSSVLQTVQSKNTSQELLMQHSKAGQRCRQNQGTTQKNAAAGSSHTTDPPYHKHSLFYKRNPALHISLCWIASLYTGGGQFCVCSS